MPPKKVTAVSGNGGMKKKKISGKRKERDFSSDDEFDYEQENNKKPGKPCAKSALQPVTVAEDIKEKIVGLLVGYRRLFILDIARLNINFSWCDFNTWALSFAQKLECPNVKGQLLVFGATNWDLIGRKEVPKQQGRVILS